MEQGDGIEDYLISITETSKTFNEYVCLDLGYDLVFVTFKLAGVDENDNTAILMNYPKKIENTDNYEYVTYRKVLFHGTQPKIVGLPSGGWDFKASQWGIHYNPEFTVDKQKVTDSKTGETNYNVSNPDNNNFTFTFTKIASGTGYDVTKTKTYEHYKINRLVPKKQNTEL